MCPSPFRRGIQGEGGLMDFPGDMGVYGQTLVYAGIWV